MNDLRYFRNDKLDLVNREKQRFGFRKLSSGKIASVLLGVTIFGSFALNGQVVKADTTADGSQPTAVVDEAKNKPTDEEEGQDTFAQKAGSGEESHEAQTGTVTPGTTNGSEAETGKTKADSTGTDSDKNGAGAAKGIRTRALVLAQHAAMPKDDQRTAQKQLTAQELVDKYKSDNLDLEHAQKFLDYYNNLNSITKILDLKATDYGSEWIERVLSGGVPRGVNNDFVNRLVSTNSKLMVKDTQAKIDERIKNFQDLSSQYPNNQDIKNTIDKLTALKDNVTSENVTNAAAMADTIDQLDKYGSQQAYSDLQKAAESHSAEVNKTDLKTEIDAAKALADDPKYYNSTNKDAFDKALSDAETVYGNDSASQQDVDDAKKALADAKTALNGSATDKDALQSAVKEADTVKGDSKY